MTEQRASARHRAALTSHDLRAAARWFVNADYDRALVELDALRRAVCDVTPIDRDIADAAARYLGLTLLHLGQIDQAVELLADQAADLMARRGETDQQTALTLVALGDALRRHATTRTLGQAAGCYQQVTGLPHDDADLWWARRFAAAGLALLDAEHGRYAQALAGLAATVSDLVESGGLARHDVLHLVDEVTALQVRLGATTHAYRLLDEALPAATTVLSGRHPLTRRLQLRRTPSVTSAAATSRSTPTVAGVARRRLTRWYHAWIAASLVVGFPLVGSVSAAVTYAMARPGPESEHQAVAAATRPAAAATASSFAAVPRPAPGNVRIAAVTSSSLTVTWTDPSGGTRPTAISLSHSDSPFAPVAVVQAAATSRHLTGLQPSTRYCVVVATVYAPSVLAAAAPACATTPATTAPHPQEQR
ncbi:fibronectin type III domain-containing protein [Dactylosporangium sp. NPDC048998]|uniref:fibronectin type III domain-containing protein n=1 Tax=Dactylosporangium sp. NPDC048998 TaxID=3363976 RepID=UPI003716A1BF